LLTRDSSGAIFRVVLDSSVIFFYVLPMPAKLTRHNGAAIRALRLKTGRKIAELAAEAKCSYQQIDNVENERKEASLELLHRIATALEVPVAALVRDPAFAIHPADRVPA
jgi:DNA-binding XRE family transcriptional regulator